MTVRLTLTLCLASWPPSDTNCSYSLSVYSSSTWAAQHQHNPHTTLLLALTLQAASCLMSALHTGQLGFLARHTVMQWWQNVCPQFTCSKSVFSLSVVQDH